MKKFLYIVFVAVALVAISCQQQYMVPDVPDAADQGLILRFSASKMLTKAAGVDNEDMVKQIEYFLFPLNSEGKVDDTTEFVYNNKITPDDGLLGTYETVIQPGVLSKLFPDGATEAVVFAVANYCASDNAGTFSVAEIPDTVRTWKGLHDLEVGATFFKAGGPGFGKRWPRVMQPSDENLFFVMAADSVGVQLHTSGSYAINEEIPLKRLASKVTVDFTYETCVETKQSGEKITWVPQPSGKETRVYLSNAICNTTLGGPLVRDLNPDGGDEDAPWSDRDLFEYAYDFMNDVPEIDNKKTAHYYTYPIQMEEGDDNQPFIKLVLPWYGYKWIGEGNAPATVDTTVAGWRLYKQMEVYYKIALPRESISEPNCIYEYSVTVNIVGSDKEIAIQGDYVIKDWLTRDPISSNVATGRYISLDIPKDHYDMYVDSIDIAFVSSGKVLVKVDSIYQMNLGGNTPTPDVFMLNNSVEASTALRNRKGIATGTAGDNVIKGWVTIPENTSYLRINHKMDNRQRINGQNNNAFDMSPYVFKVTLHLEAAGDDTTFDRTVWITQYPALNVTSFKSNGSVWVNKRTYGGSGDYTSVNNDNNNGIGSVSDPDRVNGQGTNNSQYNIIVHPTVLDSTLNLLIGDGRVSTGDALDYIAVTNYKSSKKEGANNLVSPGFLIASSYGKTTQISYERAVERCASYQENGYPAGRWRIPTEGEIQFLVSLSNATLVPSMFNGGYWASSQRYYSSSDNQFHPNSGTDTGTHYVRCVYDVWYWGEEPVETGDAATEWMGFYD